MAEDKELNKRLVSLQKILDEQNPEPQSEGERITWEIYRGALEDAIKTQVYY